jgi:multiple sugar transport system permease protein
MPSVIAVAVWHSVGYYMVLFLAGLQSIPAELYEAARVDGADPWRSF